MVGGQIVDGVCRRAGKLIERAAANIFRAPGALASAHYDCVVEKLEVRGAARESGSNRSYQDSVPQCRNKKHGKPRQGLVQVLGVGLGLTLGRCDMYPTSFLRSR